MNTYVIATALIRYKNRQEYLIGRRASTKKFSPDQWEFISGFMDTKESAEEIILREIKEETRLDGRILKIAEPFSLIEEGIRWIVLPYSISVRSKNYKHNPADHSEMKWVSTQELETYADLLAFIRKFRQRGLFP